MLILYNKVDKILKQMFRGLADTDADGKMDINEFSIACKLINLRLRGFEVPKVAPPTLLASLKMHSAPSMVTAPPRPEPPKVQPSLPSQQPLIQSNVTAPVIPNMLTQTTAVPTGIVPPLQNSIPQVQGIPALQSIPPVQPLIGGIQSIQPQTTMTMPAMGIASVTAPPPVQSGFTQPVIPGVPPNISSMPMNVVPPMVSGTPIMTANVATTIPSVVPISTPSAVANITQMSPVGSVTGSLTGSVTGVSAAPVAPTPVASSTPRASITSIGSLDRSAIDTYVIFTFTNYVIPNFKNVTVKVNGLYPIKLN